MSRRRTLRLFGTDGVRGVVGQSLTTELAHKLGRSAANQIIKKNNGCMVIGRDTRRSGPSLEQALIEGICSQGIDVDAIGVLPTPAVSYLVRNHKTDGGVVVSASHNPAEYNGIKFFDNRGIKLDESLENLIESSLDSYNSNYTKIGTSLNDIQAEDDYLEHLISCIDGDLSGLCIALDCANGAAHKIAPRAFRELGAEVFCYNCQPDGLNINLECGSTHPQTLEDICKKEKVDVGFSFDGDADRVIAVDENGNHVDGDFIMAICATELKKAGKLANNTIVTTVMTNLGFYIAMEKEEIKVLQAKVGDKYVLDEMLKNGASLGGEQSGHIIFNDYGPIGDGLITSIKLAEVMKRKQQPLSELTKIMQRLPQILINVKVKDKHKLNGSQKIWKSVEEAEKHLHGRGRILVRPSGTESLVRVMIESDDHDHAEDLAGQVAEVVESELG
ncbi:MAG: phosphoglucosamine mutase [Actinobacteria bacterium]|nr:MAG: phosphoglucosamine mutase [Actinomycetota bacterium]